MSRWRGGGRKPFGHRQAPASIRAIAVVVTCVALAAIVQASLPAGPRASLKQGVYYGWYRSDEGRFNLLGAPCLPGDPLEVLTLSNKVAGGLVTRALRVEPDDVAAGGAAVAFGPDLTVTTFSPAALQQIAASTRPNRPIAPLAWFTAVRSKRPIAATAVEAAAVTNGFGAFTAVNARCRSWREVRASIGYAAVEALTEPAAAGATGLELHVLPLPDRTSLFGVLLLWNRSPLAITVTGVRYAPAAAATYRVITAVGGFEQLAGWRSELFASRTHVGARPPRARRAGVLAGPALTNSDANDLNLHDANDLNLHIAPGGIAIVAIDGGSLRGDADARPFLSYPVVDHRLSGRTYQTGATTALYRASSRPKARFDLPAVLHSLFAASSSVGPAALLDEDPFGED